MSALRVLPGAGASGARGARRGRCLLAAGVVALLGLLVSLVFTAVPASAELLQPWFHLASVSRPGNLVPGAAQSSVQVVTVTGAPGEVFVLGNLTPEEVKKIEEGKQPFGKFAEVTVGASATTIREGLEEWVLGPVFGKGNVEVTGSCEEVEPGIKEKCSYEVTFKEALADQLVRAINSELSAALGFAGTVTVRQAQEGRDAGQIVVSAINVGDATLNGVASPVTLSDVLPAGVRAISAEVNALNGGSERGPGECVVEAAHEVQCTWGGTFEREITAGVTETVGRILPPFEQIEMAIAVVVEPGAATGELNHASVSGGGAPSAELQHAIKVSTEPTLFGVEAYEQTPEEVGGVIDAQAGSHPFQFTTTFNLNQAVNSAGEAVPAALAKDLSFRLPPGLIGNPSPFAKCTLAQFATVVEGTNECPASSVLGVAVVTFHEPLNGGFNGNALTTAALPIFNIEPSVGEPARFGFQPAGVPVFLETAIRTGGDYGVTVRTENIPQTIGFLSNTVTFWGVPGDARHADVRGYGCLGEAEGILASKRPACEPGHESAPPPFLSMPTSCTGPLKDEVEVDSWADPAAKSSFASEPLQAPSTGLMAAMDGCSLLPFGAQIRVSPDVQEASKPSGLTADVHVPQEEALNATGLAPAELQNITVTLPEGLALNPSAADGLTACTEAQVGLDNDSPVTCPNASKIANVEINTPLLPNPLKGFVYLASPQNFSTSKGAAQENPFGSLVAQYLVAEDPVSGSLIKLPGKVSLSATGQITATFQNNPQLPFEDAKLEFFGGERAPLSTPALCKRPGEEGYVTNALFEPWTNTPSDQEALSSKSEFSITSGPGGGACPNPPGDQSRASLPFAPSLASGTTNINAGSFSELTTTLSRPDGDQNIQSVTLHYPPGLSGLLSGVKLCPEAQANAGTCGPESLLGETIVSVGVGGDPFTVTGGKVYLTEKYAGAPFGLSIVNPAKAGPFDLQEGRPVVVRAKIEINPRSAALTITTDTSGAHAIPTIIEGFPLQIQHVNVTITRPGFTFNPTNCSPLALTGTINAAEGASSPASVPFQVTNCANLKFTPKLAVSVAGHASKANGASLLFKISYPKGAIGTQSWFSEAKFDLPKQLPARLETLQRACLAGTFETDRAACPPASIIGHVIVHTPVLPVPLTGSVYFVSYGGAKFPEAVQVLQGYGVTVELHGETFINKTTGVTSATFKSLPDVPFESIEVTIPTGRYSEFGANLPPKDQYNFCGQNLKMPTLFIASNGSEIHQATPINITGCKKKPLTRTQKLAAALKTCHKIKNHTKRATCETHAKKKYGPTKKK